MSVRLVNLTKEFEDPEREGGKLIAVRAVNLDIREGEFVTLLGPSGCGKTTTLRMIAGFEMPTAGEVWINGKNVTNDPPNKRDTSMVFQSYAIFPHMSVGQNVGFGLELKGRPRSEIDREVTHIMEVMGIADLARRRPDQLSGGQQQRVALARAIVNRPSVLLFDEPLSNLDAKLREQMRVEIRRIQQTFGITSVYVTHDQAEAMTVSDRIVVMNKGRMMQIGTPFEIYSRPENRFVADFIGRVNLFPVTVRSLSEGHCVAVGAAGQMLEAYSHAAGVKEGAHALLMVRPESLEIMAADKPIDMKSLVGEVAAFIRDTAEGERRFLLAKGTISKVVYLGATVEYEIEAGFDKPIQAVSHDPVDAGFWKTGDTVQLEYRPTAAHLLPLEE